MERIARIVQTNETVLIECFIKTIIDNELEKRAYPLSSSKNHNYPDKMIELYPNGIARYLAMMSSKEHKSDYHYSAHIQFVSEVPYQPNLRTRGF